MNEAMIKFNEAEWARRDGTKIKVRDMSDVHLANAYRMVSLRNEYARSQINAGDAYDSTDPNEMETFLYSKERQDLVKVAHASETWAKIFNAELEGRGYIRVDDARGIAHSRFVKDSV